MLNHVEGGARATRVYDHHSYLAEKRMALEVWSAALTRVLAEKLQTGDDAAGAAIRRIAAAAAGRRRLPDKTNRAQHEPNFDAFAILILGCRLHRHHIALALSTPL